MIGKAKNALNDTYGRNKAEYFMSFCDFRFIYICDFVVNFSWFERGESPVSFHVNLSCQISLGQRYIFKMHLRGKISKAYKQTPCSAVWL